MKAALIGLDPRVEVRANAGNVEVRIRARGLLRKRKIRAVRHRVAEMEGVRDVRLEVVEDVLDQIVGGSGLR